MSRRGPSSALALLLVVAGCDGDATGPDASVIDVVEVTEVADIAAPDDVFDALEALDASDEAEPFDVVDVFDTVDIVDIVDVTDVVVADAGPRVLTAVAGRSRALAPWFLGLDGNTTQIPSWSDPAFDVALTSLNPGTLRFPGGTAANYWDWPRGWFQVGFGPATAPSPDTVNTFAVAALATAAVPDYVLNVTTWHGRVATADDNLAMLAHEYAMLGHALTLHLPVLFAELGDGLDGDAPGAAGTPTGAPMGAYSTRFPSGDEYARQVNPWIPSLHGTFVEVQIAVVGTTSNDPSTRTTTWNSTLLGAVRGADAIALHLDLDLRDPAMTSDAVLALPFTAWRRTQAGALALARAHSLDAWVVRSGLRDQTPGQVFASTWLHGLTSATLGLLYLAEPGVTRACFLSTVGAMDTAALLSRAEPPGDAGARPPSFGPSAGGAVFAVFARALHGAAAARAITFAGAPTLAGSDEPALLGAVITDQDAHAQALLLNLSDHALTVDLGGVASGASHYEQTSARALNTRVTGAPGELTVTHAELSGAFLLAPWSLTRVYP